MFRSKNLLGALAVDRPSARRADHLAHRGGLRRGRAGRLHARFVGVTSQYATVPGTCGRTATGWPTGHGTIRAMGSDRRRTSRRHHRDPGLRKVVEQSYRSCLVSCRWSRRTAAWRGWRTPAPGRWRTPTPSYTLIKLWSDGNPPPRSLHHRWRRRFRARLQLLRHGRGPGMIDIKPSPGSKCACREWPSTSRTSPTPRRQRQRRDRPRMIKQAVDWEHGRRRDGNCTGCAVSRPGPARRRHRRHQGDARTQHGHRADRPPRSRQLPRQTSGRHPARADRCGQDLRRQRAGNKACQQYRKVLYLSADELFDRIDRRTHR